MSAVAVPVAAPRLDAFRALVERALPYTGGTHTFDDVAARVDDGRMQLWPGLRSMVLTEIIETPRTTELNLFLAAGEMDEIEALEHIIIEWARAQGCTRATFIGRRGWERSFVAKRAGWVATHTVFEKRL